jgi:plastocyanin
MLALVSVALLAGLAVGCGGGDDNKNASTTTDTTATTNTTSTTKAQKNAPSGGGAKETKVKLDEYSFDPDKVVIKKGGTIEAENEGAIAHNLTIEKGPDPKKQSAKLAGTRTFLPGNQEGLKVDLDPGKYAMVCTVAGHRDLGMVGTITVK